MGEEIPQEGGRRGRRKLISCDVSSRPSFFPSFMPQAFLRHLICGRDPTKPLMWLGFFFNDTATTEIYTLSLHDALPISEPCG